MKVLVACEFSGVVREAFRRKGCDAWSCDILPTEIPGQHLQCDVLEVLDRGWDDSSSTMYPSVSQWCEAFLQEKEETEKGTCILCEIARSTDPFDMCGESCLCGIHKAV